MNAVEWQKKYNKGITSAWFDDNQKAWVKQQAKIFGLNQSEFIRARLFGIDCPEFERIPEDKRQAFMELRYSKA